MTHPAESPANTGEIPGHIAGKLARQAISLLIFLIICFGSSKGAVFLKSMFFS